MIDWHFDRVQGFSSLSPFLFISFHFGKVKFHIRDSRNSRSLATQNVTDTRKPSNFQSEKRERCWWWDRIFLSSHFSCLSVSFIHFQLSFSLPSSSIWCNVTTCLSLSLSLPPSVIWREYFISITQLSCQGKERELKTVSLTRVIHEGEERTISSPPSFSSHSQSIHPSLIHPSVHVSHRVKEGMTDADIFLHLSGVRQTDRKRQAVLSRYRSTALTDSISFLDEREPDKNQELSSSLPDCDWQIHRKERQVAVESSTKFDEEDSNKRLLKTHSRYFDGEKRIRLDERRRDMTWHRKRWDRKGEQQQTTTSGWVLEVLVVDSFEVCTSKQSLKYTDNHIPLLTFHPLGTVLLSSWHFVSWLAASLLIMVKC